MELAFELFEAHGGHVDILQRLQLRLELFEVPPSELPGLVVSQPERADLFVCQVVRDHAGDLSHAELLRGLDAGVTRNDDAHTVDHDRDLEPELPDRSRHGVDRRVVDPRVVLIRDDAPEVFIYDLHRLPSFVGIICGKRQYVNSAIWRKPRAEAPDVQPEPLRACGQ